MLEKLKNNRSHQLLLIAVIFLIGVTLGRFTKEDIFIKPKILREDGFKYIKPVLLCNTDNQQSYNEDLSLTKKVNDYVSKSKNKISVYFLSLTNGEWASINENTFFSPASMLKVPTVVDTLKHLENNPELINKKVYFNGSFDDNKAEYFKPAKSIIPYGYYSIDDLMNYTIKYSDNNALRLLHENVDSRSLQELYSDLKIDIPQNSIDFMNTKTYSLFLRVLYNSTYLGRENSEKVIKMMIASNFPIGLKSGVPSYVEVADKFGEREVYSPAGELTERELHDCGIIYSEKQNYILCIMTKGNDFNSLIKNISDVSKITYEHTQKL